MDSVELQLKLQAFQFSLDGNNLLLATIKEEIENTKKELVLLKEDIKDINFRLENNFLSYKSLGKRLLFLASIFGAIQILFRYVSGVLAK